MKDSTLITRVSVTHAQLSATRVGSRLLTDYPTERYFMSAALRIFLLASALVALTGIVTLAQDDADTITPGTLESRTFLYDEIDRTYALYVPTDYDAETPTPLIIALHPAGGDGEDMAEITGFNSVAERENVIVLYPTGPYGYWDYGAGLESWEGITPLLDDPGFIAALLEAMKAEFILDATRIYAVGYSNGARMAYRLACELPLAAIVTVAATISDEITTACPPEARVSVMYVHGLNDQVIPWTAKPLHIDGKFIANALSVVETMTFWALQNQCVQEPEYFNLPDADPEDGLSVGRVQYTSCEAKTEVVLYGVRGGGHQWRQSPDLDTTEFAWSFMASHPRAEADATDTSTDSDSD